MRCGRQYIVAAGMTIVRDEANASFKCCAEVDGAVATATVSGGETTGSQRSRAAVTICIS
jgi:hypothetical protein